MLHRDLPRRWLLSLAAVASLTVTSCGGDDPTSAVTASTSTTTTIAATTSSAGTTTTAVPPSTVAPDTRFDPPCVERTATGAPPADDPALGTLQPLGSEPVVQLELPVVVDGVGMNDWVRAGVWRIPGGMLVHMRPYDGREMPYSGLVAVNSDGTIRWQRCLDPAPGFVLVDQTGDPDEFAVGWDTFDGTNFTAEIEAWSLADGRLSRTWDEVLADNGITGPATEYRGTWWPEDGSLMILGPSGDRPVDAADRLLLTDLGTMEMRLVPFPPSRIGMPLSGVTLHSTADGRLVDLADEGHWPSSPITAVETDGTWSTDPDDLADAVGIRITYGYTGEMYPLSAVDWSGTELWHRDDVLQVPAEGFQSVVEGDVVLARACSAPTDGENWCPGPKLVGLDAETGDTLWQKDGMWGLSVIGDGRAMITGPYPMDGTAPAEPIPWMLIDLSTGEQAGTTTWTDPWTFGIGCCDSPEGASVAGGVVFTWDEQIVQMWYPEQLSTELKVVDLGSAS